MLQEEAVRLKQQEKAKADLDAFDALQKKWTPDVSLFLFFFEYRLRFRSFLQGLIEKYGDTGTDSFRSGDVECDATGQ